MMEAAQAWIPDEAQRNFNLSLNFVGPIPVGHPQIFTILVIAFRSTVVRSILPFFTRCVRSLNYYLFFIYRVCFKWSFPYITWSSRAHDGCLLSCSESGKLGQSSSGGCSIGAAAIRNRDCVDLAVGHQPERPRNRSHKGWTPRPVGGGSGADSWFGETDPWGSFLPHTPRVLCTSSSLGCDIGEMSSGAS